MKIAKVISRFPLSNGGRLEVGREIQITIGGFLDLECKVYPSQFADFFEITEVPDGPWKPKEGEEYFRIGSDLSVQRSLFSAGAMWVHEDYLKVGNCFRTRTEVAAVVPAVRNALLGRTLKDVLDGMSIYLPPNTKAAILAAWEGR